MGKLEEQMETIKDFLDIMEMRCPADYQMEDSCSGNNCYQCWALALQRYSNDN